MHNVTPSQLRQLSKTVFNAETNERETVTIPLWVVTIEKKNEAIAALKAIAAIDHIKIRFEDYKGRSSVQQCYRCLHFGHKANQCQMKYRCLRCAEGHDTRECPKSEAALPKCANCGEAHKANSKECPKVSAYQQNIARRKTSTTVTKPPSSTEFPPLPKRNWTSNNTTSQTPNVESPAWLSNLVAFFPLVVGQDK